MAQFGAGVHQHRDEEAETPLQRRVDVNIDDINGEPKLAPQRGERT
jgi:hypothetical protein